MDFAVERNQHSKSTKSNSNPRERLQIFTPIEADQVRLLRPYHLHEVQNCPARADDE
jgi:hypothetical protein